MKFTALKFSLVIGAFFVLALLTSCESEDSADVNQDRIYTVYELFYDSDDDVTTVLARFRFGSALGTTLELNEPASVFFNEEQLAYNSILLGHSTEIAGRVTTGTFTYTNVDGETFINDVPTYETIQFPNNLTTLSKSQAFSLEWEGTALGANETVGLYISSTGETPSFLDDALFVQSSDGATNLVLGVNQLSNLSTGGSVFVMDRSTEVNVTEGTEAGGRIRGKFRANNIQVTITD